MKTLFSFPHKREPRCEKDEIKMIGNLFSLQKFKVLSIALGLLTNSVVFSQEIVLDTLVKPETLDEVFIRTVKVDADSPITHSNLDSEEIAKRNLGQNIPQVLGYLPSVVSTSDDGTGVGYSYMRVRGSDASRINVTFNGIPFNDAESQGTFWVNLPDLASSAENIQLQRGVGTSTNGSGAFGASINLITDAVSENAYGEISNAFGSFNTRKHHVKFGTGLLKEHFEISGRLSKINSDGYIDRASSDLKSYFLQGNYQSEKTTLKALVFGGEQITYQSWNGIDAETMAIDRTFNSAGMYFDEDGNMQFYDNEVDHYKQDYFQLHWTQRINNRWSSHIGLNYTYGRGYFEQYVEDEPFSDYGFTPIVLEDGEILDQTDLIRRRWLDNDFYVFSSHLKYKNSQWDITLGAFWSSYLGHHFGEVIWAQHAGGSSIRDRYYQSDATKNEYTVFTKATYKINNQWQVYGDLQGRFIHYKTYGTTSDLEFLNIREQYAFFNPKAGVSYHLNNQNQFYVSYGRAHREPTRNDFEVGVTTPEKLDDYELGWRFTSEKINLQTNIFYMNYKDQLVLTGELNDVGAPLRTSSGKSYRAGIEVEVEITLTKGLKVLPALALSTNKNKDFVTSLDGALVNLGTTHISYSPGIVASNNLVYQPIENLYLSFLSKYVSEQYMGNTDSKASLLDSFFVNDFNVVYEWKNAPLFSSVIFTGMVYNLFNVEYESNGYYYTYDDDWSVPGQITTIEGAGYYPQAGIHFITGLTLKF